jgi:hypothetical protein
MCVARSLTHTYCYFITIAPLYILSQTKHKWLQQRPLDKVSAAGLCAAMPWRYYNRAGVSAMVCRSLWLVASLFCTVTLCHVKSHM